MPYDLNIKAGTVSPQFYHDFDLKQRTSYTFRADNDTTWSLEFKSSFFKASFLYGPRVVISETFGQQMSDFFGRMTGKEIIPTDERDRVVDILTDAAKEFREDVVFHFYTDVDHNNAVKSRHPLPPGAG
ncbi:hypothetical protein [Paraburkholderia sediminicola]|uniref:hypothetical protein n=1 Tax=Paraburkholderia sediminicola TaxID=458836 RepID=UPI0038B88FAF